MHLETDAYSSFLPCPIFIFRVVFLNLGRTPLAAWGNSLNEGGIRR